MSADRDVPEQREEPPRCPLCGYSKEDQLMNGDHHICEARGGRIPSYRRQRSNKPKSDQASG